MVRISLADKLLERFGDLPEHQADYLLAYDFHGVRIPTSFYSNLGSVLKKFRHEEVGRSLLRLHSSGAVEIIASLVRHYHGEVRAFEVKEEIMV